ncbi:hypothetical protein JI435_303080, partial [Parastagonospora nodorum SN15]
SEYRYVMQAGPGTREAMGFYVRAREFSSASVELLNFGWGGVEWHECLVWGVLFRFVSFRFDPECDGWVCEWMSEWVGGSDMW